MYNKVILVGNLTRDVEIRYIQNGTALAKTSIATNRRFKSQNGEQKDETCFIDITLWGRSAEIANQYLKKGSKVLVDGRLTFEQWTDQNGQNRSKHSLTVETIIMLDKKENSTGNINNGGYNPQYQSQMQQQRQQMQQQSQVRQQPPQIPEIDISNDDIPF